MRMIIIIGMKFRVVEKCKLKDIDKSANTHKLDNWVYLSKN